MKRLITGLILFVSTIVMTSCDKDEIVVNLQCDVTSTNVTSFGADDGTITVTVKKGNGGYEFYLNDEYHVDGNFTELEAGTYNVKVTDNEDQMFTKSVTITEPLPNTLDVDVSNTDVTYNGGNDGTITLTVNDGYKPFKYFLNDESVDSDLFDHTFSNLLANTYTVKVIDSLDRTFTKSVTLTEPEPLDFTYTFSNVTCNGLDNGTITVIATGEVEPYTYKLFDGEYQTSNVFENLSPNLYTVWVKSANGIEINKTVNITEPDVLDFTYVVTNPTSPSSNGTITVTATGGTQPYTYQLNSGTFYNNNELNAPTGTHSVTVKDNNGCTKTIDNIVVDEYIPVPPIVNTLSATEITGTTATLNGWIETEGFATSLYFEYGTTTSYGNIINLENNIGGSVPVYTILSNLSSQTTYHFRLVATNSGGTTYGDNMTFTTGFKVGDLHLDGTIFIVNGYVDGDGQTGSIVKNDKEDGFFTWLEADNTWPQNTTGDWRLGTRSEMTELIKLDVSGQLNNGVYVDILTNVSMWINEDLTTIRKTTTPPDYYIIYNGNTLSVTHTVRLVKSF